MAVVALLLFALGLTVGPRVEDSQLRAPSPTGGPPNCLVSYDLPGPFGLLLNCDSPAFVEAAAHPGALLEPGNWRQNRPGQIWVAWLVSQPVHALIPAMHALTGRAADNQKEAGKSRTRSQAISESGPAFVAYFVINIGLLLASLWVLRRAVGWSRPATWAALLVGAALMFNDITKAYLLSPHSQLMNLLVPLVAVAVVYRWLRGDEFTTRQWLGLGFLCGLGLLAYATWALVPAALGLVVAWSWMRGGVERARTMTALRRAPAAVAALAAPYALWYAYVVASAGYFYVHETSYDQGLVWMLEGDLTAVALRLAGNAGFLLGAAIEQALPYMVFAAVAALVLIASRERIASEDRREVKIALAAALVVTGLFLCFFSLLGFRAWRYAVPLLPAWTLPIALLSALASQQLAAGGQRRLYVGMLAVTGVAVALYQIVKDGPWG